MKRLFKIAAILMVFCMIFSTAAFAAGGEGQNEAPQSAEKNAGRWAKGCPDLPFAPGTELKLVDLDSVAWDSGEYSGTPIEGEVPEGMPHYDTPKEIPLLVLVLGFNNIDYQAGYDWGEEIFKGSDSLAQYYKDMSFNQFAFVPAKETSAYGVGDNTNTKDTVNDGIVHIKLDAPHEDWSTQDDPEMTDYVADLKEAILKADDYVDFASFDANGDGELTNDEFALAVVVAGYEGAFAGDDMVEGSDYYLWSFAWNLASGWYFYYGGEDMENDPDVTEEEFEEAMYAFLPCPDDVYVSDYITIPEQLVKGEQEPISVLAHELGHYLGLPDLYTTDYDYTALWGAYDVGYLSVMCSGSWGYDKEDDAYRPVAFDAWSRSVLGWVTPTVAADGEYEVYSDKADYNVLMVETGVEGDYYLIETREFTGWDAGLDIDSNDGAWSGYCYADYVDNGGLICWHVDDGVYDDYEYINHVNNTYHRPALMPLYPEVDPEGNPTFIGEIDFDYGTAQPFFTYELWQEEYAPYLDCVDFPTYNGSDDFEDRTFSGVEMEIIGDLDHGVKVRFGDTVPHEHDLVKVDANDPTLFREGNIEYWMCSKCGKRFADEEGTIEVSKDDIVIPKLGFTVEVDGEEMTGVRIVEEGYDASYEDWYTGTKVESLIPLAIVSVPEGTDTAKVTLKAGYSEYNTYYYTREPDETGYTQYIAEGIGDAETIGGSEYTFPVAHAGVAYDATVDPEKVIRVQSKYDPETWTSENLYAIAFDYARDNEIVRLAGANRYDTALAAAEHLREKTEGGKFANIIVASGKDFPDALSATYLAYVKDAPILLVGNPASITSVTEYANKYLAEGGTVYIVGGTGAVDPAVDGKISGTVKRLAGSNRYATNIEVLKEAGTEDKDILIASGKGYADALSASAAGRPILLVGNALTADQRDYLRESAPSFGDKAYIVGGTGAVNAAVESDLKNFFKGDMKRFAGKNRYETSQMVANEFFQGSLDTMVIASGKAFPDGLSGGPVATAYGAPLLLVTDGVVDHAKTIFTDQGLFRLVVMGGKGAVSTKIAEDIAAPAKDVQ